MITQEQIEEIITIFQKINMWNDGRFFKAVNEYCSEKDLNKDTIHTKLSIAFRDYLATNMTSENCIRFRLSRELPENAAL